LLDWIQAHLDLDSDTVLITGDSYRGFMIPAGDHDDERKACL